MTELFLPIATAALAQDSTEEFSAVAQRAAYSGPFAGYGTAYATSDAGNLCYLSARKDQLFAAFPRVAWDNGAQCERCINVKGPTGNINVKITDSCYGQFHRLHLPHGLE